MQLLAAEGCASRQQQEVKTNHVPVGLPSVWTGKKITDVPKRSFHNPITPKIFFKANNINLDSCRAAEPTHPPSDLLQLCRPPAPPVAAQQTLLLAVCIINITRNSYADASAAALQWWQPAATATGRKPQQHSLQQTVMRSYLGRATHSCLVRKLRADSSCSTGYRQCTMR